MADDSRKWWLTVAILAAIFLLPRSVIRAAETEPSTQPAPVSQHQIKIWVQQLGSDDPQSRRAALDELMTLKRRDLPTLRAVAMSDLPLLPQQVAAIREAVTQVYLTEEPYKIATDPQQDIGFLGLQWPLDAPSQPPDGVLVWSRIPGFVAYRVLQPGDIIVKIINQPAQPDVELHDFTQFTTLVRVMHAGEVLRLQILRYGRPTDVSIRLDHRPVNVNDDAKRQQWLNARTQAAEEYWNHEFSAIDPGQVASSTQP